MDFANLDLRAAASKEYWVQLRVGDTLLYADEKVQKKPCRVRIGSPADPEIEEAAKAVKRVGHIYAQVELSLGATKASQQQKQVERRLDALDREAEVLLQDFLRKAIKGWENIEFDGKELAFSPSALEDMSQPKAPLFRMATEIAEDAAKAVDPFSDVEVAS